MSEGNRPSHRLVIYHGEDTKNSTEVGAAWPHKNGPGLSIVIKEGVSLSGNRLNLFKIDWDEEDKRRDDRPSDRGGERDTGSKRR